MCVHLNYNAPALVDQTCECVSVSQRVLMFTHTHTHTRTEVSHLPCVRLKLTPSNAMQVATHLTFKMHLT